MKLNQNQVGLAGEYYVLAQLTAHGYIATLTHDHTSGVTILVTNHDINKIFKVKVQASTKKPSKSKYFGDGKFYTWAMNEKHERIMKLNLVYCFVHFHDALSLPKFFLVPSMQVADYVEWQHKFWLKESGGQDTSMRQFRINTTDPDNYSNRWSLFN